MVKLLLKRYKKATLRVSIIVCEEPRYVGAVHG